jgi:CDP-6-deoxy-D-xylo-4-hexulose-3-dehydrase
METESRLEILKMVRDYANNHYQTQEFTNSNNRVNVSGKVYDADDLEALVDASLDFWLTTGRYNDKFEEKISKRIGSEYCLTTNSGSSANLLAFSSLFSPNLKDKALKPGDEVITVACGFPTTVNPIIQNQCVPVFIDVSIPTYNVDINELERALSPKTKAIMIAHTLGNPFEIDKIMSFAKEHDLYVVEDCCDALGSTYNGQHVGTFGDMGTLSFYPAHHITMGEGGAVYSNHKKFKKIIMSYRDWGRDCWCPPGIDNSCNKRFDWDWENLPASYDHKYVYSHIGYNLKITDMQAAVGYSQLNKLDGFIQARKDNFNYLYSSLKKWEEFLYLPEATLNSDPSWFGFMITIKENKYFDRIKLVKYLNEKNIMTRMLFAGNITMQPYFKNINHRVCSDLTSTNLVMNNGFWIGLYPGLGKKHLDYVAETFSKFFKEEM